VKAKRDAARAEHHSAIRCRWNSSKNPINTKDTKDTKEKGYLPLCPWCPLC
jgi:hypothetical protein